MVSEKDANWNGTGITDEPIDEKAEARRAEGDTEETASSDMEVIADEANEEAQEEALTMTDVPNGTEPESEPDGKEAYEVKVPSDKTDEAGHNATDRGGSFVRMPVAIGIAIACAIGGGVVGYLANNPRTVDMTAKTTLTTDELDTVVGRVEFDGKVTDITARQAIMLNGTLDGDSHDYPSADAVLSTARNIVMEADAKKRGIQADDEVLSEFMTDLLGSSDYETVAQQYQLDVDSLKALVRASYYSQEVRKQVIGTSTPTPVDPPETPDKDKEDIATRGYYDYIIESAGDEWDAKKGSWADEKGDFAVMLGSSKTFDPKGKVATYDDALGAYQVLGGRYSAEASAQDTLWNDYMKKLLSGARISVYSLVP